MEFSGGLWSTPSQNMSASRMGLVHDGDGDDNEEGDNGDDYTDDDDKDESDV